MFEHHLPPHRESSAGGAHSHAGGAWSSLEQEIHQPAQQHRGARAVGAVWQHQTPSLLSQHLPGHKEWALLWDQADTVLNSREEGRSFQKVLSIGHSARTLRLGKTPPHMEKRALSHPKLPPPPPVIHPSQQKRHLQNTNTCESPVCFLLPLGLFWKYHTIQPQCYTALEDEGDNTADHEFSWKHWMAGPSSSGSIKGHWLILNVWLCWSGPICKWDVFSSPCLTEGYSSSGRPSASSSIEIPGKVPSNPNPPHKLLALDPCFLLDCRVNVFVQP